MNPPIIIDPICGLLRLENDFYWGDLRWGPGRLVDVCLAPFESHLTEFLQRCHGILEHIRQREAALTGLMAALVVEHYSRLNGIQPPLSDQALAERLRLGLIEIESDGACELTYGDGAEPENLIIRLELDPDFSVGRAFLDGDRLGEDGPQHQAFKALMASCGIRLPPKGRA